MKILYVSHYATLGGANIELAAVCVEMKKKGNDVVVAFPSEGSACQYFTERKIPYIIVPYRRWICDVDFSLKRRVLLTVKTYFNNVKYGKVLSRYIKDNDIEIVHTNDTLTVVGAYAAADVKIPHVWHLRELLDEDYQINFLYSNRYVSKWFSKAQRIIAISKTVLDKYRHLLVKENYSIVSDGIDLSQYQEIEPYKKIEKDCFCILYTGGTSEKKGFSDVLYISNELKKRSFKFRVIITGDCTTIDAYSKMIDELGIGSQLEVRGFVKDLNSLRAMCDLFIMPSVKEAFGLVTVEAMLANLIVLGRDSGGTSEIIQDSINGFLYRELDYAQAADKIIAISNMDSEKLDKLKKCAKNNAIVEYNIKNTVEKLEKIYMEEFDEQH